MLDCFIGDIFEILSHFTWTVQLQRISKYLDTREGQFTFYPLYSFHLIYFNPRLCYISHILVGKSILIRADSHIKSYFLRYGQETSEHF